MKYKIVFAYKGSSITVYADEEMGARKKPCKECSAEEYHRSITIIQVLCDGVALPSTNSKRRDVLLYLRTLLGVNKPLCTYHTRLLESSLRETGVIIDDIS